MYFRRVFFLLLSENHYLKYVLCVFVLLIFSARLRIKNEHVLVRSEFDVWRFGEAIIHCLMFLILQFQIIIKNGLLSHSLETVSFALTLNT